MIMEEHVEVIIGRLYDKFKVKYCKKLKAIICLR